MENVPSLQLTAVRARFYSGPIRGIFSNLRRANILGDVQTLVLDGLTVTADLVHDILTDPSYSVRILSLRQCKHLSEKQLRGALQYACRSSRPDSTPRLKGLYIFGKAEERRTGRAGAADPSSSSNSINSGPAVAAAWNARSQKALAVAPRGEEGPWYGLRGWQFAGAGHMNQDWAQTLLDSHGLVAFDAVLCRGPRHLNSPAWGKVDVAALDAASSSASLGVPHWNVAQFSVGGCTGCGSAPEGWTVWGEDDDATGCKRRPDADGRRTSESADAGTNPMIGRFPLLSPLPLHSSSVKVAMCPAGQPVNGQRAAATTGDHAQTGRARFIPRCGACLHDRYCAACHRWWCESCYVGPWAAPSPPRSQSVEPSNTYGVLEPSPGEPQVKVRDGLCFAPGGCGGRGGSLKKSRVGPLG